MLFHWHDPELSRYLRNSEEFGSDAIQVSKFRKLIDFFDEYSRTIDGHINDITVNSDSGDGTVVLETFVFDINEDDIQRFVSALRSCSEVVFKPTKDGEFSITCTIPRVLIPKHN